MHTVLWRIELTWGKAACFLSLSHNFNSCNFYPSEPVMSRRTLTGTCVSDTNRSISDRKSAASLEHPPQAEWPWPTAHESSIPGAPCPTASTSSSAQAMILLTPMYVGVGFYVSGFVGICSLYNGGSQELMHLSQSETGYSPTFPVTLLPPLFLLHPPVSLQLSGTWPRSTSTFSPF